MLDRPAWPSCRPSETRCRARSAHHRLPALAKLRHGAARGAAPSTGGAKRQRRDHPDRRRRGIACAAGEEMIAELGYEPDIPIVLMSGYVTAALSARARGRRCRGAVQTAGLARLRARTGECVAALRPGAGSGSVVCAGNRRTGGDTQGAFSGAGSLPQSTRRPVCRAQATARHPGRAGPCGSA